LGISYKECDKFSLCVDGGRALSFVGVDGRVYNNFKKIEYKCLKEGCRDPFCKFMKSKTPEERSYEASLLMFSGFDFSGFDLALSNNIVRILPWSIEVHFLLIEKDYKGHNVEFTFWFSNLNEEAVKAVLRDTEIIELLRISVSNSYGERPLDQDNLIEGARYVWIFYGYGCSNCSLVTRDLSGNTIVLRSNAKVSEIKKFKADQNPDVVNIKRHSILKIMGLSGGLDVIKKTYVIDSGGRIGSTIRNALNFTHQ
jgi:hypothetical protein